MLVIMIDANARNGLSKVDAHSWQHAYSRAMGPGDAQRENGNGKTFKNLMERCGLASINSWSNAGPTSFPHTVECAPSRIDHVCTFAAAYEAGRTTAAWLDYDMASAMQARLTRHRNEHVPVFCQLFVQLKYIAAGADRKLDRDTIAFAAMHGGVAAEALKSRVEQWAHDNYNTWDTMRQAPLGKQYDFVADALFNSVADTFPPIKLSNRRIQLLRERREWRKSICGTWQRPREWHHQAENWNLLTEDVWNDPLQWQGNEELLVVEKKLKKLKRVKNAVANANLDLQITDAALANESRTVWRLARKRASAKLAPKNRFFDRLPTESPSAAAWAQHFARLGPAGGDAVRSWWHLMTWPSKRTHRLGCVRRPRRRLRLARFCEKLNGS
jgi:hypothetical protein